MSVLDVAGVGLRGRDPDRPVLTTSGGALTSTELLEAVDARALELRGAAARADSPHAVVMEPDQEGIVTLLAAWRAGLVPAPLNPRLTRRERDAALAGLTSAPPGTQAVLWTSGTSGRPRGVALGREGLEAHVEAVSDRLALDGSEVWLASLSPVTLWAFEDTTKLYCWELTPAKTSPAGMTTALGLSGRSVRFFELAAAASNFFFRSDMVIPFNDA